MLLYKRIRKCYYTNFRTCVINNAMPPPLLQKGHLCLCYFEIRLEIDVKYHNLEMFASKCEFHFWFQTFLFLKINI